MGRTFSLQRTRNRLDDGCSRPGELGQLIILHSSVETIESYLCRADILYKECIDNVVVVILKVMNCPASQIRNIVCKVLQFCRLSCQSSHCGVGDFMFDGPPIVGARSVQVLGPFSCSVKKKEVAIVLKYMMPQVLLTA